MNEARCDVGGVIDDTQVDQVFGQWQTNGVSEWKIPLLRRILEGAAFSGKTSTPWSPGRSTISCTRRSSSQTTRPSWGASTSRAPGSGMPRTSSRSAIPGIADRLAEFVDEIRARYPAATLPA